MLSVVRLPRQSLKRCLKPHIREDCGKRPGQISDASQLEEIVLKVIEANPSAVEDVKNGKDRAIGFLVGQVMKETRGKANPGMVNQILKDKINSL